MISARLDTVVVSGDLALDALEPVGVLRVLGDPEGLRRDGAGPTAIFRRFGEASADRAATCVRPATAPSGQPWR